MSHQPTYYARNEDGALWKASQDLGRESRDIEYRFERLEDGQVKLEVTDEPAREGDAPKPEKLETPIVQKPSEAKPEVTKADPVPPVPTEGTPGEIAQIALGEILRRMGLDDKMVVQEADDAISIQLADTDETMLFAYGAQLLDSFQYLINRMVQQVNRDAPPIILDVGNRLRLRNERITAMANRVADKAIEIESPILIETAQSDERRLIHHALSERKDIETASDGAGAFRHLAVIPRRARS